MRTCAPSRGRELPSADGVAVALEYTRERVLLAMGPAILLQASPIPWWRRGVAVATAASPPIAGGRVRRLHGRSHAMLALTCGSPEDEGAAAGPITRSNDPGPRRLDHARAPYSAGAPYHAHDPALPRVGARHLLDSFLAP